MEKILANTRRPDITFYADGHIHITVRIARILQLSSESCINIAIDNGEYLLFAEQYKNMIGKHSARCYSINKGGQYFRANSVRLCRAIMNVCGTTDCAPLFCGEPVIIRNKTYIPIITRKTL